MVRWLQPALISEQLCRKGEVTCTVLIGEVVLVHVLEAITARTAHNHVIVDLDKYAPVSRMGGDSCTCHRVL